jgi:type I restriction enzyme S subunit
MSESPLRVPLEDLANIVMGQSPPSPTICDEGSGLPFLQGCAEFGTRHPNPKQYCDPPLRVAKAGATLISVRAPVGAMNVADQDYCIGRGLGAVEARPGITDEAFLHHAIESGIPYLHRRSQGSTFLAISAADLRSLPVPRLDIEKQRRIAEILSTVDEAIEQTEALIAKTQQIKAGLMHDLFTRGVTPDGRLRPPREQAPDLYKQSPLGWIPREWEVGLLIEYLDPATGVKPGPFGSSVTKNTYTTSGFRVYGQEQVLSGSLGVGDYYISREKFAELRAFEVAEGDVLLSLVGTVGRVLIVEPPFERGIVNPRLLRLRPIESRASSIFIAVLLTSPTISRQIESLTSGGTMPVINGGVVRRLKSPIISRAEQDLFVKHERSAEKHIASLVREAKGLREFKAGLMRVLFEESVPFDDGLPQADEE